jgi:hypothetical protein
MYGKIVVSGRDFRNLHREGSEMKDRRRSRRIITLFGIFVISAFFPCFGHAALPATIEYQGYLTDAQGVPVNGEVQMVFSLYRLPSAPIALWSETQSVTVTNGVYLVNLGKENPLNTVPFEAPYYLGIKVGAEWLDPRIPLTSAGLAYRARMAENAGGWVPATGVVSLETGTDKVGIGATAPLAENLVVKGETTSFIGIDRGWNQDGGIKYKEAGQTQWIFPFFRGSQYTDSNNLIIRDEKYQHDTMVFQAGTANVGIGADGGLLPGAKLDVIGDVRIRSSLAFADGNGTPYLSNRIGMAENIDGATKWLYIGGITGGTRPGTKRLALFADRAYFSGLVGINKMPAERLDVEGNIRMTGTGNGVVFPNGTIQKTAVMLPTKKIPPPAFDSGWRAGVAGKRVPVVHNVGGDVANYVVDLQFRNPDGLGVHNQNFGGDKRTLFSTSAWYCNTTETNLGAYYGGLTSTQLEVTRNGDDVTVSEFRVRIWTYN